MSRLEFCKCKVKDVGTLVLGVSFDEGSPGPITTGQADLFNERIGDAFVITITIQSVKYRPFFAPA